MFDSRADKTPPADKPLARLIPATTRFVYRHLSGLARVAFIPYLIVFFVLLIQDYMTEGGLYHETETAMIGGILLGGLAIAQFFLLTAFSTAWHRYTLSDGRDIAPAGIRWGMAEWRFLGYSLLISIVCTAVLFASGLLFTFVMGDSGIAIILQLACFAAVLLFSLRFMLVLPAMAVGDRFELGQSFRATRGHSWELAGIGVVMTLLIAVFFFPVSMMIGALGNVVILVKIVWLTLAQLIANALFISALSLVYRRLTGRGDTAPAAAG